MATTSKRALRGRIRRTDPESTIDQFGIEQYQLRDIVRKHLKRGWSVCFDASQVPKDRWGQAHYATRTIYCHPLHNLRSLQIFLHECAHAWLRHDIRNMPDHSDEFEAEKYAIHAMMAEGIKVPRGCVTEAKDRIRDHIEADRAKGVPIMFKAVEWTKS